MILALDEAQLVDLFDFDETSTRRAVPAGLHRRAARRMAERLGVLGSACSPLGQKTQGTGQLVAGGAQLAPS